MSEQIREQISAFLDGELPDSETELLLKRMARDTELRECFGRYALIADVVRDPKSRPLSKDFMLGVNRRIDGEPEAGLALADAKVFKPSGSRRWWRPIAGAAVAAGVAAVAVVALERRSDVPQVAAAGTAPRSSVMQAVTGQSVNVPVVAGARREALSYTVPAAGLAAIDPQNPAILPAARLTNYVFAHSKYSSTLGQRNVLSGLIGEQPDAEPAASVVSGAGLPAAGEPPLQP